MAGKKQNRTRINWLYATYHFRENEQDPVIDKLRTAMDDSGIGVKKLAEDSGVSKSTINYWLAGKTMRPKYCTVAASFGALGYAMTWNKAGAKVTKRYANKKVVELRAV